VESLPIVAPSCSLSEVELREQLARYRVVGDGAKVLEWSARRRAVPEPLVERLVEVERQCCPLFELSWDSESRRLTISVSATEQEPALDAITYALGLGAPA
jgi:hypothetical protein